MIHLWGIRFVEDKDDVNHRSVRNFGPNLEAVYHNNQNTITRTEGVFFVEQYSSPQYRDL